MSAVEIASTGWGTLLRPLAPGGALVPVVGATCQINLIGGGSATIWTDNTRTATLSQPLTTGADGTLPGFIDLGTYIGTWTIAGTAPFSHQLDMAGPTGLTGPPGVGASWQGVWSSSTTYTTGQGVYRNGAGFISNANSNLNHDPATDTGTYWGPLNAVSYLPAPTGVVATDTTTIQNAINALPSSGTLRGGTLVFQPGVYQHSGLDVSQTFGITFQGPGEGHGSNTSAQLLYTGSGIRAIDARGSNGFTIRGVDVRYNNAAFTGILIDYSHKTGNDAGFMLIENARLGAAVYEGVFLTSCAAIVSLNNAIDFTARNSYFQGAQRGVRGIDPSAPGYSNAHVLDTCSFDNLPVYAIGNVGQGLTVEECRFEGTAAFAGSAMYTMYGDDSGTANILTGARFVGGWFGDMPANAAKPIFSAGAGSVRGLEVRGMFLGGNAANPGFQFLHGAGAVTIENNYLTASVHVDFGTVGTQGFAFRHNYLGGASALTINGIDLAHNGLEIRGNVDQTAQGVARDKTQFAGHFLTQRESALAPTVTAGANMGAGATVSLTATSNDMAGRIVLTTGTAPGTGEQRMATVTFARAYTFEAGTNEYPRVMLTLRRSDSSPPPTVYSPNGTLTTFDVQAYATLAASTVYIIDYHVFQ